MVIRVLQISLRLFFLLVLVGLNHAVSSEQLAFDLDKQKLIDEFQSLSNQIEFHFAKGNPSMYLHVERGNLSLVADEYASAVDDYSYVINCKIDPSPASKKILYQALWGRMWAYTFLEQEKKAIDDIDSIKELMQYDDHSELDSYDIFPCKKDKKDKKEMGRNTFNLDQLQECLNTVGNTERYMIQKAYKVSDAIERNNMLTQINLLFKECQDRCYMNCCYENYWKICVQSMVDQIEEWKKKGLIK